MSSKPIGELTLQTLKGDNANLRKEIITLKRQLSGYKTSNDNYKMQIAKQRNYAKDFQQALGEARENLERAEKERDEKAKSLDNVLTIVAEKDKQIAALNGEIKAIKKDYEKLGCSYADACIDRDTYKANYKYVCSLPWYKRVFYKVK